MRRACRGPCLLQEREILLGSRGLGERLADIGRAGEELSAGIDSDDGCIPPLAGR